MSSFNQLPRDLPYPIDDGACDHLEGISLPDIALLATNNERVNFSEISGRVVIYLYPMTGHPDAELPDGWDQIPGARGCTPQSCSFRDHYEELRSLNASVYGLSTQTTAYQAEARDRLDLPFQLVSDQCLEFISSLSLPIFEVEGASLSKRITLIANQGVIEKVFYPVFPPDQNADQVMAYLNEISRLNKGSHAD